MLAAKSSGMSTRWSLLANVRCSDNSRATFRARPHPNPNPTTPHNIYNIKTHPLFTSYFQTHTTMPASSASASSTATNTNTKKARATRMAVATFTLSPTAVGRILGSGGSNIKDLRARLGGEVAFLRVGELPSTSKSITKAKAKDKTTATDTTDTTPEVPPTTILAMQGTPAAISAVEAYINQKTMVADGMHVRRFGIPREAASHFSHSALSRLQDDIGDEVDYLYLAHSPHCVVARATPGALSLIEDFVEEQCAAVRVATKLGAASTTTLPGGLCQETIVFDHHLLGLVAGSKGWKVEDLRHHVGVHHCRLVRVYTEGATTTTPTPTQAALVVIGTTDGLAAARALVTSAESVDEDNRRRAAAAAARAAEKKSTAAAGPRSSQGTGLPTHASSSSSFSSSASSSATATATATMASHASVGAPAWTPLSSITAAAITTATATATATATGTCHTAAEAARVSARGAATGSSVDGSALSCAKVDDKLVSTDFAGLTKIGKTSDDSSGVLKVDLPRGKRLGLGPGASRSRGGLIAQQETRCRGQGLSVGDSDMAAGAA